MKLRVYNYGALAAVLGLFLVVSCIKDSRQNVVVSNKVVPEVSDSLLLDASGMAQLGRSAFLDGF